MCVDIIIPIYNAFDDLQICLNSLYANTDLQKNRLILINDNSPDERIKPYLDEQLAESKRTDGQQKQIIVIHNESNKGFSANINLGMEQSEKNDVILLNSDTVLTKNWVEKMLACAYSDRSIGTVTPVSNNATLCSVPIFCEENTLPKGMSVEQAGQIVEECSMRKYPRITVAHGFCMLVKREVINAIGGFDAETFGRGYGEENDFCNRAEQMGYVHVMCDDTYIYHSGTKSFVSKEKEAYIREHDRILHERYPAQMHNNAVHCRDNPNGWVGQNIGYHFDIWNGRKNVLYLLQSDFKEGAEDNVGGTQLHVKHLTKGLCNDINVFVAARDKGYLQVTAYVGEQEHTFKFAIGEKEEFPVFHNRRFAEVFAMILKGFRIDLVHVHHTATTSLDIYYEADKLGIPIVYTAHDFYYVCPTVKLLNSEGEVCIGKADLNCVSCLNTKCGIYHKNDYLALWRRKHEEVLELCQMIVTPSESAREILGAYYPKQKEKIIVSEHGMDAPKLIEIDEDKIIYTDDFVWKIEQADMKARCPFVVGVAYLKEEADLQRRVILRVTDSSGKRVYIPTNFGRNLDVLSSENRFYGYLPNGIFANGDITIEAILVRENTFYMAKGNKRVLKNVVFHNSSGFKVAFIGGISEEKGGKAIAEIIKRGSDEIEWYVFGGIGEETLFHLKKENLIKTGYYYQEDLYTFLQIHQIDAICILSKWAETFSYTLSEAVLNGVPVIATDIGALGQRVAEKGYGVLVSAQEKETVKEVIDKLAVWKAKGEEYQRVKECARNYAHTTIQQMILKYKKLYEERITCQQHSAEPVDTKALEALYQAYACGMGRYEGEQTLITKISELENKLRIIDNSVTFKIVKKITGLRIPLKGTIRKLLVKK